MTYIKVAILKALNVLENIWIKRKKNTYPVFSIYIGSTVNEKLGTFIMSCSNCNMEGGAAQLKIHNKSFG